ncbi:TPA: type III secretion system export apparatus protein Spa29/SpaR, partial [Shigella flexneri]|nr:type III secretion system export apparatus protein SpaR [Shigella flexneri]EFX8139630.1 EscT/YscT/HrcT family type III secretion system export apparatus protein [Shigella sonnei]EFV9421115.1 type III secretion system export apparatus protein SpaR [Shigella flexneri]EFY3430479.1 type III secretion system export apparatus protein SpaR [Shigella flexneri]EFZ7109724.1 type III secretion system export apparatus protein SpaR [Shigella sonnei]
MDISSWFESIHVFLILLNGVFFRLAPLFFFLPFLNNGIISPSIRIPVIFLVASGLITSGKVDIGSSVFEHVYFLMFKEIIVGLLLSFCLSLPFWIFHAVGSIIDNQRGATLSSSIDPANGVDTSELAKFFNLFSAVVFLYSGGMVFILESIQLSYNICPLFSQCSFRVSNILTFLTLLASQAVILASPVMIVLLLSEVLLGVLSRFAPQMNAFSVSLTIKSLLAIFIIFICSSTIYFSKVQFFLGEH